MESALLTPARSLVTEPIEDATRREFITGVGSAALAAAFLAACGDDATTGSTQLSETRTFTDAMGTTVQIPARPQRIVSLDANFLAGPLLALNAPVVGIANNGPEWTEPVARYFADMIEDVKNVGFREEIDVETIIALEPDLIVHEVWVTDGAGEPALSPAQIERLAQVAPLVGLPAYESLEAKTERLADLLGIDTSVVDAQRAEFEGVLAELTAALGERPSEITAGYLWTDPDGGAWAAGRDVVALTDILNRTGVTWYDLGRQAEQSEYGGWLELSMERLHEFNCDLLLYSYDLNPAANISDHPLYGQLQVVQAGQVIEETESFFGTHYPNYIACARWMLDRIRAMGELRTDIV